jgi:GMP synthase (glutamine-hydrolysing)
MDMRDGFRDFVQQIEVRCWESVDARMTPLSYEILEKLASEIIREVPGIVSVTYNIAPKPPSAIEAV